jgi:hypothetical protein
VLDALAKASTPSAHLNVVDIFFMFSSDGW